MKIKLNTNLVAIRPLDLSSKWSVDNEFDAMRHVTVKGRVEAVCSDLDHTPAVPPLHHDQLPEAVLDLYRLQSEVCLAKPTVLNVAVGDEVLFAYMAHMNCIEDNQYYFDGEDRILVMRYDMLSFNFTRSRPLNDYVFVEPVGVEEQFIFRDGWKVYYDLDAIPSVGKVIYGPDPGRIVRFPAIQVPPEYKYHQQMNPGGLPLLRIPINEIIDSL